MKRYIPRIAGEIETIVRESLDLLPQAQECEEGWTTSNGTLFLPAPPDYQRDKQIMVLALSYQRSAAFFRSALDQKMLDIVESILGADIELFSNGQCVYKEPVGGHPKHLHQDAAYFEHRYEGPVGVLTYVVDTDLTNGALHVVPGSFKGGLLDHVDTFSHLGLDQDQWPWERALPITGEAGDSIFFHVDTIHGSKPNYSERPRPVFIHRYRRADDYVVVSATTARNRAEAKKRADEAANHNQRGFMVRGFRHHLP